LEHPLNAGVHLVFFDKFATRNLVDTYLHLLFEPLRVGQHLRDRLLYQLVRAAAGLRGELIELDFLVLGQVHFHGFSVGPLLSLCQIRNRRSVLKLLRKRFQFGYCG
jgi:hypothetical protein